MRDLLRDMEEKKLRNYPIVADFEPDFQATREYFGTGIATANIGEYALKSEKKVVYLDQRRESNDVVNTPRGPMRRVIRDIVVCGYLVEPKGWLRFLKSKKIELIPNEKHI